MAEEKAENQRLVERKLWKILDKRKKEKQTNKRKQR